MSGNDLIPRIPLDLKNFEDLAGVKIDKNFDPSKNTCLVLKDLLDKKTGHYAVNVKGNLNFVVFCRERSGFTMYSYSHYPSIVTSDDLDMTKGKLFWIELPYELLTQFVLDVLGQCVFIDFVKVTVDDFFKYPIYGGQSFKRMMKYLKPFGYMDRKNNFRPEIYQYNHLVTDKFQHVRYFQSHHIKMIAWRHTNPVLALAMKDDSIVNVCAGTINRCIIYTEGDYYIAEKYIEKFKKWTGSMDSLEKFKYTMTPAQLKVIWDGRHLEMVDF